MEKSDIVTLQIQNTKFICSRSELVQNSDYFKAMFEGNFAESSKSVITLNVAPLSVSLFYIDNKNYCRELTLRL